MAVDQPRGEERTARDFFFEKVGRDCGVCVLLYVMIAKHCGTYRVYGMCVWSALGTVNLAISYMQY
jgi:hypothetical protein